MSEVRVKGLAELNKFLQELPAKVERNVLRGGLRAGAMVVRDAAKEQVPVDSGKLRDGLKVTTGAKGGRVVASVKATGAHAYIAPWLEYGTKAHRITAKGKGLVIGDVVVRFADHPGINPRPFMRPALDSRAAAAVVAAANYMKRRLATKHGLDTSDLEIEAE